MSDPHAEDRCVACGASPSEAIGVLFYPIPTAPSGVAACKTCVDAANPSTTGALTEDDHE